MAFLNQGTVSLAFVTFCHQRKGRLGLTGPLSDPWWFRVSLVMSPRIHGHRIPLRVTVDRLSDATRITLGLFEKHEVLAEN